MHQLAIGNLVIWYSSSAVEDGYVNMAHKAKWQRLGQLARGRGQANRFLLLQRPQKTIFFVFDHHFIKIWIWMVFSFVLPSTPKKFIFSGVFMCYKNIKKAFPICMHLFCKFIEIFIINFSINPRLIANNDLIISLF